jgi:hypothetical protein
MRMRCATRMCCATRVQYCHRRLVVASAMRGQHRRAYRVSWRGWTGVIRPFLEVETSYLRNRFEPLFVHVE